MAAAGAIVGLISAGVSAAQGLYQAKVADMNAEVAGENAKRASARAAIEAQQQDWATRAKLGEEEVAQAGSGVTLGGRSQILTRRSTKLLGRQDTLNIVQAGSVERYNYLVQKENFKAEAANARIGAVGSIVGGIAGVAGQIAPSLVSSATAVQNPARFAPKPLPKPLPQTSTVVPKAPVQIITNPLLRPRWSTGGIR